METTETVSIPTLTEEQEDNISLTERSINNIDTLLKANDIEYFIVGSIARYSYMDKSVKEKNEIDILVPEQGKHEHAQRIFDLIEERNVGIKIDTSLTENLCKKDGSYYLKHGDLEHKLDEDVIQKVEVESGNAKFNTLPPETLLHTFILGGSNFRDKDWKNAFEYARWLKQEEKPDHSKYKPFHDFARDMWTKSSLKKVQHVWRRFVRNLPDPAKDSISKIYGTEPVMTARNVYNEVEKIFCGSV